MKMRRAMLWVTALVILAVFPAIAAAAGSLRWSAPRLVDHQAPFSDSGGLISLSCPSVSLCVAGDDNGSVVTSTNPTNPSAWRTTRVNGNGGVIFSLSSAIPSLSCPTVSLCVGVAGGMGGDLITTTRPLGGARAWTHVHVAPANDQLVSVSCPTSSFCVAIDMGGDVVTSTHPTGGGHAWHRSHISGGGNIGGLSCASASLCAAVDDAGDVITTTNPAGGGSTWHRHNIDGTEILFDVSCASSGLCVATDGSGNVLTSTNPGFGAPIWTPAHVDGTNVLDKISCRSTSLCVSLDNRGNIIASHNPTGGAAAWTVASVDTSAPGTGYGAISCPSDTLCAVVDDTEKVLTSTNPTGGAGAWSTHPEDLFNGLAAISCPAVSLCVAVDHSGNVLTSTQPSHRQAWTVRHVAAAALNGISCPSRTFCVAVDDQGNALTTHRPTGGAGAWTVRNIDPSFEGSSGTVTPSLTAVSCSSAALCVTGDEFPGRVITSKHPTGGASAWKINQGIGVDAGLDGVSCPSRNFCVVATGETILASTHPTRRGQTSTSTGASKLDGAACVGTSLCVAVDEATGRALSSHRPASRHPSWTLAEADPNGLLAVSCPALNLCVAADDNGNVATTTTPNTRHRWQIANVDGANILTGVSCPAPALCVAIDATGRVLVGTPRRRR